MNSSLLTSRPSAATICVTGSLDSQCGYFLKQSVQVRLCHWKSRLPMELFLEQSVHVML